MIPFRSLGEAVWDNGGAPITPGMPPGWQVDDLLWLHYATHNIAGDALVAEPAGWTLRGAGTAAGAGGNVQLRVYSRRAQAGDSGPTLEDGDIVPRSHHAYIAAFSGQSLVGDGVDVAGAFGANGNNNATINSPSITPTTGDRKVLVASANASLCTTTSVGGSPAATERADENNPDVPTGPSSSLYEYENTFDGATGTGTRLVTFSQPGARVTVQVSLRPATTARALAVTEVGVLTLTRPATFARAFAALETAVASLAGVFIPGGGAVTHPVMLVATAVGVARLTTAEMLPIVVRAVYHSLRFVVPFKGRHR